MFPLGMAKPIIGITYVDTEENILSADKNPGLMAYSTDTNKLFISLGSTTWREIPFATVPSSANPDMGYTQESSQPGYGRNYVTDKLLASSVVGSNDRTETGAIRISSGTFQIYLDGAWGDVATGLRLREDALYGYVFEHKPIGSSTWIELMSGNSLLDLGLNGLPVVQAYKASMGAYPSLGIINGGTF